MAHSGSSGDGSGGWHGAQQGEAFQSQGGTGESQAPRVLRGPRTNWADLACLGPNAGVGSLLLSPSHTSTAILPGPGPDAYSNSTSPLSACLSL